MERNIINEFARMVLIAAVIALAINLVRVMIFGNGDLSVFLPQFMRNEQTQSQTQNQERFQRTTSEYDRTNGTPQKVQNNEHHVRVTVYSNNPRVNSNLASVTEIPLHSPGCFNGMPKQVLLSLRQNAVKTSPIFSDMNYQPKEEVFGIVDGLPWISLNGALHFSKLSPQERTKGPSRESVGILNPELLYYVSVAENQDKISPEFTPLYKDFNFIPYKVIYNSETNTIEAHIRNEQLERGEYSYQPIFLADSNARDLGYKYAFMNKSKNVRNFRDYRDNSLKRDIKELTGYYTRGSICGVEGGCNNYAPYWQYYNHIYLKDLPAYFNIKLWKERPVDMEQRADINFRMVFE